MVANDFEVAGINVSDLIKKDYLIEINQNVQSMLKL